MATRPSAVRIGWLVALLALSVLLNYVDRGAIGIAAPRMKSELGLSATQFGLGVSAFFWTYAPLCLVMGWLCDRFCVYRVFALGLGLWAVCTFLTGWVSGLGMLVMLRIGLGMGEAIAFPGSSKIFAAELPPERRGLANAAIAAALAFGPAVGTLAGGTILGLGGWRAIFWTFGALTLVWLVPWHLVSAPLRGPARTQIAPGSRGMAQLVRLPALWLMSLAHFLSNYGFYFLLTWLPLWLTTVRGYSIAQMTLVTTVGFLAQGLAALAIGHWSDTAVAKGAAEGPLRRRLMIAGHALAAAGIAGLWFAPSPLVLAVLLVLAGIGLSQISTNLYAVGQIFAGPRDAGRWIGFQNAFGNVAGIVGPLITGLIIDRLGGYGWGFAVAAGIAGLGALHWWLAVPEIRQVTPAGSD